MTPERGHRSIHERGSMPEMTLTGGWVYDNEPWHWPPKERSIPMGITKEQYARAAEIREHVEVEVGEVIQELTDDRELVVTDIEEARIVGGIVEHLFAIGLIDLEAVEARL